MQTLLSYGDGESAVKITHQNERILFLLEHHKDKNIKSKVIEIRELVECCLRLQQDCDEKLESITSEYKKELNTHLIKRQLKTHLKNT